MESQDVVERIDNKYVLFDKKGEGATSKVYLVKDPNTDKFYAGKILLNQNNLFDKEIEILNRLRPTNNPYIINLIDSGNGEIIRANKPPVTKSYLILEYASKGELFNYIFCPKKGLQEKFSKIIFAKILKGVQSFHNQGICHRDLKMQNVLLDDNFNPKICDFGFATLNNGKLTESLGTLNYAAPEVLLKQPYDGFKADIFSLGVVLLTLVSCKIGFVQARKKDPFYRLIMTRHYDKYWSVVSRQITGISEELKNLYIKMVQFRPDERPTIEQILNDEWFNEIRNLNDEQLSHLEEELRQEFVEREKIVNNELRRKAETDGNNSDYMDQTRAVGNEDKKYFDLSLKPQFAQTGLNMQNYIKIKGDLDPVKYMNSLANRIMEKNENCSIQESKKALKKQKTQDQIHNVLETTSSVSANIGKKLHLKKDKKDND